MVLALQVEAPNPGFRAILELLYPKADGAAIHCFKVLTIAGKTIIESAVAGVPIARGFWFCA